MNTTLSPEEPGDKYPKSNYNKTYTYYNSYFTKTADKNYGETVKYLQSEYINLPVVQTLSKSYNITTVFDGPSWNMSTKTLSDQSWYEQFVGYICHETLVYQPKTLTFGVYTETRTYTTSSCPKYSYT